MTAALAAGTAGATTPAASNSKFCDAVSGISSDIGSGSDTSNRAAAKALAKSIRKAGNSAPKNVKKAMNTMADYFEAVGKAGSNTAAAAAAAKKARAYAKAIGTFTTYYTQTCANLGS